MPYCECGNFVTSDYIRVFASNDGTLYSCYMCGTKHSNHQEEGEQ